MSNSLRSKTHRPLGGSSFRDASRVGSGLSVNGTQLASNGRCTHVGARYLGTSRISDGLCNQKLYTHEEQESGLCCNCQQLIECAGCAEKLLARDLSEGGRCTKCFVAELAKTEAA